MKKYSFILILSLCFGVICCKSSLAPENATQEEIISTNDYIVYLNESSQLTEYVNVDNLENKTESEVINLLGKPTYIIEYKSKNSSIFDCKILIYTYYKSTDGTSLAFKNNIFINSYTDSIDSIDSYKVENLLSIFNK